jgi:membrane protein
VILHRFAPDRKAPLRAYLPGAIVTLVLVVVATLGMRIYFAISGGFTEAYGAFGAVLAFVFYLYVIGLVLLIGGVINAAFQDEVAPGDVVDGNDSQS